MFRRIIISYALALAAGIVSGYILFEKLEFIWGGLFMLSTALLISRIKFEGADRECRHKRIVLLGFMLLGFIVLTLNYTLLNRSLVIDGETVTVDSISNISGRVVDVQVSDDKVVLIIKTEGISGLGKVRCTVKQGYKGERVKAGSAMKEGAGKNTGSAINADTVPSSGETVGLSESAVYYEMLGSNVEVYGKLREPSQADNPGCFNYRLYLKTRRIRYTFSAGKVTCLDGAVSFSDTYWSYRRWIILKREEYLNRFDNPEIRSLIKGIIFGDKSDINDETIEEFNTNSTGHLLAVSGLHIGFLYTLLQIVTGRRKNKTTACIIIAILFLYGEMTKWNPSTVRAVIVMCINLMSIYFKKRFDLTSGVCASAIIVLVRNPYQLFNTGFQMSYMALLGIAFLSGPMQILIGRYLGSLVSVQLAVSPMIAAVFYRFNIISLFVNIPVVAIASWLVPLAISGLAAELVLGFVPRMFVQGTGMMTQLLLRINHAFAVYAKTDSDVTGINPGLLIAVFLIVFMLSSEWFRVRVLRKEVNNVLLLISGFIIPTFCLIMAFSNGLCHDQVTFVAVGQGDCTHISSGSVDILIDGGGSTEWNTGKNTLKPYLLYRGAGDIDAALVTHLHTDHFKGLDELSQLFPIQSLGNLACGEKLEIRDRVTIEAVWPLKSELIHIDSNNRETLKTLSEGSSSDTKNENNTVYIVNYEGVKIMITGDMEEKDERAMAEYYKNTTVLKCPILKAGHHGSRTSSSEEFLDAVNPQVCVISVGLNNIYGHPNQEVLDRFEARGIPVYRTDLQGAIGFRIRNGKIIRIDSMR